MSIAHCIALALLTASAQSTQPATRPTTHPATRPAERQASIDELLAEAREFEAFKLRGTEELPADVTPEEAVMLRVIDGLLVAEFKLPPQYGNYRLPVAEGRAARMTVRAFRDGDEPAIRFVDIERPLVGDDHELETSETALISGFTALGIDVARSAIQLARHVDSVDGHLDVTLTQRPPVGDEVLPYISLRAGFTPADAEGSDDSIDLLIETNSFADLRRDHREAFDRYVLPALDDLGLATALDADTRQTAIQVFLAELPVEEGVEAQVTTLLAQLDSDKFAERAAAQRELETLGQPAATVLARMLTAEAAEHFTGEQAARVQAFLATFRTIDAESLARLRGNREFLENVAALTGAKDAALRDLVERQLAELPE